MSFTDFDICSLDPSIRRNCAQSGDTPERTPSGLLDHGATIPECHCGRSARRWVFFFPFAVWRILPLRRLYLDPVFAQCGEWDGTGEYGRFELSNYARFFSWLMMQRPEKVRRVLVKGNKSNNSPLPLVS
jgi:hypothetical protein